MDRQESFRAEYGSLSVAACVPQADTQVDNQAWAEVADRPHGLGVVCSHVEPSGLLDMRMDIQDTPPWARAADEPLQLAVIVEAGEWNWWWVWQFGGWV